MNSTAGRGSAAPVPAVLLVYQLKREIGGKTATRLEFFGSVRALNI
jgi:hypothetical protein